MLTRSVIRITRGAFLWSGAAALIAAGADADIFGTLRVGGYALYFRHGPTDHSQSDTTTDYNDCSKQRNLTAAGRGLERRIGEAIRALAIPIGPVVTDKFCRTRESAQLLFGKYTIDTRLMPGAEQLSDNLRHALATPPPEHTNIAYVLHHNELVAIGGPSLAEGDAAVYKSVVNGAQLIAQVAANAWLTR
jgi:broad specificity phosphatase PhoE